MPTISDQTMPSAREWLIAMALSICIRQPDDDLAVAELGEVMMDAVRERPELAGEVLAVYLDLLPVPSVLN